MVRVASSATRTDSSATRLFVSITRCKSSRTSSLWTATKSCTERQPGSRFSPSMFFVIRSWANHDPEQQDDSETFHGQVHCHPLYAGVHPAWIKYPARIEAFLHPRAQRGQR